MLLALIALRMRNVNREPRQRGWPIPYLSSDVVINIIELHSPTSKTTTQTKTTTPNPAAMLPVTRRAFSAATALHRVFIAPTERPLSRIRARPLPLPKLSTTPVAARAYAYAAAPTAFPRDEEILDLREPYVHLVGEDGKLTEPKRVRELLASIDRDAQSLVTVALPSGRAPSPRDVAAAGMEGVDGVPAGGPAIPVCKVIVKAAARESAKTRDKSRAKRRNENPALTLKTLELNWAIDPHDLGHRLKRMREFLEKGFRVDVLLAPKRKKRRASPEEAEETLRKVQQCVEEVEGAKEWKPMEGKVGAQVLFFAQGKPKEKEPEEKEPEM